MTEQWRPIPGYEDCYEVSDLGRVRSLSRWVVGKSKSSWFRKGRILSPKGSPYLSVTLSKDGSRDQRSVHELVLTTFRGPRPKGQESRHLNDEKQDNRLENLLWGTHRENLGDLAANGKKFWPVKGETHHAAIYSDAKVKAIIRDAKLGAKPQRRIAAEHGVSQSYVSSVLNGKKR